MACNMVVLNSQKSLHSFNKPAFPTKSKCISKSYPATKIPARSRNAQIPINMALITSEGGVTRRIGNHHPNLWDDDFIQSLSKSYEDPCYGERAEKMIREIKDMFNALPAHSSSADDLHEHLSMVDNVERLGIDRHFQNEIKSALDYVYRYWDDERGIGSGRDSPCTDLNTTALGLRILRLHRYGVSSEVLHHFNGKDEWIFDAYGEPKVKEIKTILNLFRASIIPFPRERVMDEAKAFAITYLKEALHNIGNSNLSREIEFNIEYGWHTNVPRLEAMTYIDIYGEDSSWGEKIINNKSHKKNWDLLELAKLDFNMIQSIQQRELQILSRWWAESGLSDLEFARHRHVEYYFWAASVCIEPKYSSFRIGFAKLSALVTYLDDIYDTYGTFDELVLFTKAIKRWDLAATEGLPKFMKVTFKVFDEALRDMARDAEKTQGRDTLDYARKWEVYIDAYMQEAKWFVEGYVPTLEEYLENGK
ncbi:hypothetical protein KI387_035872, partial [Taxus chinensis]